MSKKEKRIKQKIRVSSSNTPSHIENPESFYNKIPVWSFRYIDNEHGKWGTQINSDILPSILYSMKSFEQMKWSNILTSTSGRSGNTRSHPIPIQKLIPEAQKRFNELNLDEIFDEDIYSLALTNKLRLFGFIDENGIFFLVWIDREHEIYKVYKKHT